MLRHWFSNLVVIAALLLPVSALGLTRKPAAKKIVGVRKPPAKKLLIKKTLTKKILKKPVKKKVVVVDRRSVQGLQLPAARCMMHALGAFKRAGVIYTITSVRRSYSSQLRLWRNRFRNRYPVARPGTSMHELGLAIDLTFTRRGALGRTIMRKYGFSQPVRHDPVHWECRHNSKKQAIGC